MYESFRIKNDAIYPGAANGRNKNSFKKIKPHPELIALSKKIIDLGEPEGYTVLGSYYFTLGLRERAFKTWEEGEKKGSLKSGSTKALIEFQEGMEKEVEKEKKDIEWGCKVLSHNNSFGQYSIFIICILRKYIFHCWVFQQL